jgi:hypothetical protein
MYTICHPAMRIRPSQDAIARMAYSIWQSKGSHPTSQAEAIENWYEAERLIAYEQRQGNSTSMRPLDGSQ